VRCVRTPLLSRKEGAVTLGSLGTGFIAWVHPSRKPVSGKPSAGVRARTPDTGLFHRIERSLIGWLLMAFYLKADNIQFD
jgi:hypothetical protein